MKLFIERSGSVICTLMLGTVPIGIIVLSNYLYQLHESQGLNTLQWVISWVLIIGWTLVIGTILLAILSGMISDLIKLFKWLFIEPFKK